MQMLITSPPTIMPTRMWKSSCVPTTNSCGARLINTRTLCKDGPNSP